MRRRSVVLIAAIGLLSAGIGDTEERNLQFTHIQEQAKTVFVVITPPAHGQDFCSIVPLNRKVPKGVNHVTIINLSHESVELKVSSQIAKTDGSNIVRDLGTDEFQVVELKPLKSGSYPYKIDGAEKGCLWRHPDYGGRLPNPKIVIP